MDMMAFNILSEIKVNYYLILAHSILKCFAFQFLYVAQILCFAGISFIEEALLQIGLNNENIQFYTAHLSFYTLVNQTYSIIS